MGGVDPSPASASVRVALWHTNCVIVDVPSHWDDKTTERHILSMIDAGEFVFESVEGGLYKGHEIPKWWRDQTPQSAPDGASTLDTQTGASGNAQQEKI